MDLMQVYREKGPVECYRAAFGDDWTAGLVLSIPDHMWDGVVLWVVFGIRPGDFLSAVIDGDLFKAAVKADLTNREQLFNYAYFFYNCAPSECFKKERAASWKGVANDRK